MLLIGDGCFVTSGTTDKTGWEIGTVTRKDNNRKPCRIGGDDNRDDVRFEEGSVVVDYGSRLFFLLLPRSYRSAGAHATVNVLLFFLSRLQDL